MILSITHLPLLPRNNLILNMFLPDRKLLPMQLPMTKQWLKT